MKKENIIKEIERIKSALIKHSPDFKYDLCDHEIEEIKYQQEFEGKSASGLKYEPFFRCKKCKLILNADGSPEIVKIYNQQL